MHRFAIFAAGMAAAVAIIGIGLGEPQTMALGGIALTGCAVMILATK